MTLAIPHELDERLAASAEDVRDALMQMRMLHAQKALTDEQYLRLQDEHDLVLKADADFNQVRRVWLARSKMSGLTQAHQLKLLTEQDLAEARKSDREDLIALREALAREAVERYRVRKDSVVKSVSAQHREEIRSYADVLSTFARRIHAVLRGQRVAS